MMFRGVYRSGSTGAAAAFLRRPALQQSLTNKNYFSTFRRQCAEQTSRIESSAPQKATSRTERSYLPFYIIAVLAGWIIKDEVNDYRLSKDHASTSTSIKEASAAQSHHGLNWQGKAQPALDLESATAKLRAASASHALAGTLTEGHATATRFDTVHLASNSPIEDRLAYQSTPVWDDGNWNFWGVFDGHAGWATAETLRYALIDYVARELKKVKGIQNEADAAIETAFLKLDEEILSSGLAALSEDISLPQVLSRLAPARAGSCALLALHDPKSSILKIANVGDSRAVLGRLDTFTEAERTWTAVPLSEDQTGFNEKEKARILAEHPGETDPDLVNAESGRVIGIMVSRAFGDNRWKWPQEALDLAAEKFHGSKLPPKLKALVKTPPYLTAKPDIMSTTVKDGDFLIIASDGLWDHISSETAVDCVGKWVNEVRRRAATGLSPLGSVDPSVTATTSDTPGFDHMQGLIQETLEWKASPRDFVLEENNAATHLAKNALGGKRRDIFTYSLSLQPPISRDGIDDVTIQVIFFGSVEK